MTFGVLNSLMLLGLAATVLPVIAHLLSKRRYDVVQWGAMRFLELGRKTRQRIQLQDLLLLFLRMLAIACVALALARPWGRGSLLGSLAEGVSRDIVFIIDGSTSMAWQDDGRTPHQDAIQAIHEALEDLGPSDSVTVFDARQTPRMIAGPVAGNWKAVRDAISQIPPPAGSSNIPAALVEAVKSLADGSRSIREIIVLTDGQALPWRPDDVYAWERVDDRVRQSHIQPALKSLVVGPERGEKVNFSVGPIELSREITVPEFPVRIGATISQSGGETVQQKVSLQLAGQQLENETVDATLPANGKTTVEFEHAFDSQGDFILSVAIEDDALPQDNRSQAIITVTTGIPVLLVDGDPRLDETKSESFFVESVFRSSGKRSPWIHATTIPTAELDAAILDGQQVVFLLNVPRLTASQQQAIQQFAIDGGGIVIAPGERTDHNHWNGFSKSDGTPFLPAEIQGVEQDPGQQQTTPITVDSESIESSWLSRFREETGVDFWQTRFSTWWNLATIPTETNNGELPRIIARLTNGRPLLIAESIGDGTIVLSAVPFDADWSTWPAKNDFVPFLHELVFHLTSSEVQRNVQVGTPLLMLLEDDQNIDEFIVNGPWGKSNQLTERLITGDRFAVYSQTEIPGKYTFLKPDDGSFAMPYIVTDSQEESNLAPLTISDWTLLTANDRLQQVDSISSALTINQRDQPRAELWWLLLAVVLLVLIGEVALTRKMVQEGHAALDEMEALAA